MQGQRFGPTTVTLAHNPDGFAKISSAHMLVRDVVAQALFINPFDPTEHAWNYGFFFRSIDDNKHYRLYVDSDRNWYLTFAATGNVNDFHTIDHDESNILEIVAIESYGLFLVNNTFIRTLNLSVSMVAGDVDVALGFCQGYELAGRTTRVVDFAVNRYILSPIRAGNIIVGQTGLGVVSADQDVSDFVLEAE